MTTQSEQTLENNLIKQLQEMKYERVVIADEKDLLVNLKTQLEKHNETTFTDKEFAQILNHLSKGNVYDKAQTLRDKFPFKRDGQTVYVEFFNTREWCQNEFQVTSQVTQTGSYKNRYDVTLLVNGLPLVQIELKRRGLELKEAFNQVQRYHKHSFDSGYGLFQYVQIFVISNGVNTKYYANNRKKSFKFTSFWTDKDNNKISELSEFARVFLDRCHVSKMIAKHTVLTQDKTLMLLRPYQYYAVEAIIDRVKNNHQKNGYIWHTTGSGKTLTSFKASQILQDMPEIYKVVFVVDRNDLDTQTIREFNKFQEGSVDTTDNTGKLVKQFADPDRKLIVTTIQKLNNAISGGRHELKMGKHKDEKIVFIFDECHRSQFGETHKKITEYFSNKQLFGFTGTPIFADNASGNSFGKRTTKDLFGDCLHKYVITDAINDENVLKFSVEYVGRYKRKATANEVDIEVEDIDRKELMESPQRLEKIADYILANHERKTHSGDFNAIFAVSSVDVLTKYYEIFKAKQDEQGKKLKIATIFTYAANEEDKEAEGLLDEEIQLDIFGKINQHSRDKLESYIKDYNKMFGTNYSTDSNSFYNYYRDIADKVKKREIDILLVVNMFLTGFDSPELNTLYVDKNLRYHGLLQAYSRTNRIYNERKSQGNIVVFRNLKKATDQALELFANKDAKEVIFREPYEEYLRMFDKAQIEMQKLVPTPPDVDGLISEEQQLKFVTDFRELMRIRNILITFADFTFDDLDIREQTFNDFKSKYLDIYDKVKTDREKEKVSILDDVDFELELVRVDKINVDYILRLLAKMVGANEAEREKLTQNILDKMSAEPGLRSKRELIERFINQNIPEIKDPEDVEKVFEEFWTEEKTKAFEQMCREEGVLNEEMQKLIDNFLYSGRKPRNDDLVNTLKQQPRILERESIAQKLYKSFTNFIETFIDSV